MGGGNAIKKKGLDEKNTLAGAYLSSTNRHFDLMKI